MKKLQKSPKDEFGVTHVNLILSKEKDKFFCLLDPPNKEALEKHHHKAGIKCDWVMEVKVRQDRNVATVGCICNGVYSKVCLIL